MTRHSVPGGLESYLHVFGVLLSKYSLSQNKYNLNLSYISSSSDDFTHLKENSATNVSVGFQGTYLCPS